MTTSATGIITEAASDRPGPHVTYLLMCIIIIRQFIPALLLPSHIQFTDIISFYIKIAQFL